MALYDLRINYDQDTLLEDKIPQDPLTLFEMWFKQSEAKEPNAMCLSTVCDNKPSSRMVLCKSYSSDGFTFFTNHKSRKGLEISSNPFASIVFYWEQRSVRIEGVLSKLSEKESQDYFSSRPRTSQIGAWTSPQSQILSSRKELDDLYVKTLEKFQNVECIPKPEFWGGYILKPDSIEFWQGRPSRLHDRIKPKRRFLTEKSQIPTRLHEVKPVNKIYFTPSKPQDQIFISTPSSKYSFKQHFTDSTPHPIHTQSPVKLSDSVPLIQTPSVKAHTVTPAAMDHTVASAAMAHTITSAAIAHTPIMEDSIREKSRDKFIREEEVVKSGKSNKRAFYEEELKTVKKSKKDKFKTPRNLETLKRKSTFTVMEQEELDLLPEKGWITPASRRLGRRAAKRPMVKQKSSVMCQTMPVQQESKRLKVTPAIDRFKPKIPDSISKPALQGDELDEKTVQVLLNAAKENSSSTQSLDLGFKAPMPLAKENISPNVPTDGAAQAVDNVTVAITSVPSVSASEMPKFGFSAPSPAATIPSSVGTAAPAPSSGSPPKPAFSFPLPGSTTPILSTVPAAAAAPKLPFSLPSSITTATGTTAAPSSSFPPVGITVSAAAAPTSTASATASSLPPVAVTTLSDTPKVGAAPAFNFATPAAVASAVPPVSVPATPPINFSFGAKSSEGTAIVSAAPTSVGTKESAISSASAFAFKAPASTAASPSVPSSTAPTGSLSFGTPAAASTTTAAFSFGSSVTPSTVVPQTTGVSQPSLAPSGIPAFSFGSSGTPSSAAPQTTGASLAPSAVPAFGFGSSAAPSTAPQATVVGQASVAPSATPAFGFGSSVTPSPAAPQATGAGQASTFPFGMGQASKPSATSGSTAPFGQTATSTAPFGQSNPLLPASSTSSSVVQPATAPSPFGQTTSVPFGQSSTSVTQSPFGQGNTSSTPFGQANTTTNVPVGQNSSPFVATPPSSAFGQTPSTSAPSAFAQAGSTPAPFTQQPASSGFGSSGTSFGQGSGFPSSSFGQASSSSTFNPATPVTPFGSAPTPFGNAGSATASAPTPFGNTGSATASAPTAFGNASSGTASVPSFGFSNAPAQFGGQAPTNASASTFTFGQPQGSAPAFSFGAQPPAGAPASSGFSFNASGGPQMPQMPSGPGFSLGSGGDTTRKLAQPKGRLRKAGLRR